MKISEVIRGLQSEQSLIGDVQMRLRDSFGDIDDGCNLRTIKLSTGETVLLMEGVCRNRPVSGTVMERYTKISPVKDASAGR